MLSNFTSLKKKKKTNPEKIVLNMEDEDSFSTLNSNFGNKRENPSPNHNFIFCVFHIFGFFIATLEIKEI
jgi:hypothetical protein